MKAFVTGATGFIGGHIVEDLLSTGIEVRVLIRDKRRAGAFEEKGVECVVGDILDENVLGRGTRDADIVFSAFGILGGWGIPERRYRDINTRGVELLLESCLGRGIRQFIHVSSAGVLGPIPDGAVADETFPPRPSNVYERTKAEAERRVSEVGLAEGIPFTIIRPEFVYGPGDRHVLHLFRTIRDQRFYVLGAGRSLLHPTYIEDLIRGIRLCVNNPGAVGKIYLITGERPYAVDEFARIIAEELAVALPGIKIPLSLARIAAKAMETGARITRRNPLLTTSQVRFFSENRAFTWEKARSELGFAPRVSLRQGVRKTVSWYRREGLL